MNIQINPLKNTKEIIKENHKILAYSAKNKRANLKPPYSTLKPDTSSDSPSAKSKGARLVSAIEANKKTTATGKQNIKKDQKLSYRANL